MPNIEVEDELVEMVQFFVELEHLVRGQTGATAAERSMAESFLDRTAEEARQFISALETLRAIEGPIGQN